MKPVPADAVIVDLDGTLVDTLGDFEVALNAMLADLQLPCVEREDVRRWVGRGSEHLIACALTHTTGQPDGGLAAPGWLHYQRHYARINGRHSAVYPGALDALQAWQHRGLLLACLTNKPAAFARSLLRMKGLEGNSEVTGIVSRCVGDALKTFLEENPNQSRRIIEKVVLAATARNRHGPSGRPRTN